MSGPVDVLENLAAWCNEKNIGAAEYKARSHTYAAVSELIEADREYDVARNALVDVNRHIAEKGWIEIEFDALRKAGERFVRAQIRRDRALANVGSAP